METFNGVRLAQAHQAELVAQAAQDRLAATARHGVTARHGATARSGRRSWFAVLTGWWTARTAPASAAAVEAAAIAAGGCEPAGAC